MSRKRLPIRGFAGDSPFLKAIQQLIVAEKLPSLRIQQKNRSFVSLLNLWIISSMLGKRWKPLDEEMTSTGDTIAGGNCNNELVLQKYLLSEAYFKPIH